MQNQRKEESQVVGNHYRRGQGRNLLSLAITVYFTCLIVTTSQATGGFPPELIWFRAVLEPKSLAYSSSQEVLAVPARQGTISLYRVQDRVLRSVIPAHDNRVNAVAFSPDGNLLASGSDDKTVKVWQISQSGRAYSLRYTLQGHTSWINAVAFSPDGSLLASASHDGTIRLWDTRDGTLVRTITGHSGSVTCIAFSPDGQRIASGSEDRTVRIWQTSDGLAVHTLEGHNFAVRAVAFSPDGSRVASGSDDRTMRIWDPNSGTLISILSGPSGHSAPVTSVTFVTDGSGQMYVVSGSEDTVLKVWRVSDGSLQRTMSGHTFAVRSVLLLPDGHRIASGSDDATVRIWRWSDGAQLSLLGEHTDDITAVAVYHDGSRIASAGKDGRVILRDLSSGEGFVSINAHSNWIYSVAFSSNGQWLATGSRDNTVRFWNAITGEPLPAPPPTLAHPSWVYHVSISPDNTLLATVCEDGHIRLWDTRTGGLVRDIGTTPGYAVAFPGYAVAFSPDNTLIAAALDNGTVRVYRVSDGQPVTTLNAHTGRTYAIAFSPMRNFLASAGQDGQIKIWNTTDWSLRGTLSGHEGPVYSIAFSVDGSFLVSGGEDNTVRYWSVPDLTAVKVLQGHSSAVRSVALSRDGVYAASAGDDAVTLWRVREAPYNVPPSVPQVFSPADGAIVPPTPTFELRTEDANNDRVRFLMEFVQGENTITQQTEFVDSGKRLTYTLPTELASGEWTWRVKAQDAKGSEGAAAEGRFTVSDKVLVEVPAALSAWGLSLQVGNKTKADLGLADVPMRVWDPTTWQYREVAPDEVLVPGTGYWMKPGAAARLIISGAPVTSPVTIHLKAGWNHISSPLLMPVTWSSDAIRVRRYSEELTLTQAHRVGWIAGYAWGWNAEQARYQLVHEPNIVPGAQTQLAPWQGYWIYAHQECDLVIAPSRREQAHNRLVTEQTPGPWSIRLQVQLGTHLSGVFIGGSRSTQDITVGLPPDPPSSSPIPKMYLARQGTQLAADLRAEGRANTPWEVVVQVPAGSTDSAVLLWQGTHNTPRGVNPVLVDLQTGERKFLRTTSSHTFAVSRHGGEYRFRIEMLHTNQLLKIMHARVSGGRSTGGRYTISYQLSDVAQVDVSIMANGKMVRRLVSGITRSAGVQQITWDGRDSNGIALPAGAYVAEIRASSSDGQVVRTMLPIVLTR
jgi:WD40 repeat protein